MRIAILDLGTNTFHLLIADVNGGIIEPVLKIKSSVKLGEGAIQRNFIAEKPFRRGISALSRFKKIIDKYKPDKICAYATSAIRSAENGNLFVEAVMEKTGISVDVISGLQEAELIYHGVKQCVDFEGSPGLIMDIGGGSTEFIIADNKNIYWKKSFDIGAARILEIFHPSNPITSDEINTITLFLDKHLSLLKDAMKKYQVSKLVGSSGSFDTFAEMTGWMFHGKNVIRNINSFTFDMEEFYELLHIIIGSTTGQRLKMKGLVKMRVDMIVIAGICVDYIIKTFKIRELVLSKYALKEGALWKILQDEKVKHLDLITKKKFIIPDEDTDHR